MLRKGLITLFILLISACGGGGGGGGSSAQSSSSGGNAATFSPDKITLNFYSGESIQFSVVASASTSITGNAYVQIVDANQVLDASSIILTKNSTYNYTATLRTNTSLAAGHYMGSLAVHICKDASCGSEWPGSPVPLPYDFTVMSPADAPRAAAITPSPITGTYYEGDQQPSFTASVHFSGTHDTGGYLVLADGNGVIAPLGNSVFVSQGTDQAITLNLLSSLTAPGHYTGQAIFKICPDSSCASQIIGSPISLNYDITILPSTNLTTLTRWSGVDDWSADQGSEAHTGYVPVTLDVSKFIRRWVWNAPGELSEAVTADGLLYASVSSHDASNIWTSKLVALNEADGSVAWQHDFQGLAHPPVTSGGKVFVARDGNPSTDNSSYISGLGATDGSPAFETALSSLWNSEYMPAVSGGAVYVNGRGVAVYASMYSFDAGTGAAGWTGALPYGSDFYTLAPALDSTYAYVYTGNLATCSTCSGLSAFNLANGTIAFTITDPHFIANSTAIYSSPALTSNNSVLTIGHSGGAGLIDFDLGARAVKWEILGDYRDLGYAGGVVYALNISTQELEARNESDGSLLWSWSLNADDLIFGGTNYTHFEGNNLIVTNNMILLSTDTRVYAISASTHQSVWTYEKAGKLALSPNGILYISSGSELHAINMK